MASDGNRHVKVKLNCPNCRADISGTIEDTICSRRKSHAEELQKVPDSELSAKDLQLKYWNKDKDGLILDEEGNPEKKGKKKGPKPLEIDPALFGGLEFAMSEQEQKYVTELMTSGYPDQLCQAAQILSGVAELLRQGKTPAMQNASTTNNHNTIQANRSSSPTHNAAHNAGRAASTLQGGYSNAGIRTNHGDHVSNFQRQMEEKAREKVRRPLPARMPLCVTLSTGEFEKMALKSRQEAEAALNPPVEEEPKGWFRGLLGKGAGAIRGGGATMTFVDDEWDGTVADAFARARIGPAAGNRKENVVQARVGPKSQVEQMNVRKIIALGAQGNNVGGRQDGMPPFRSQRVLVGSVRGQAGKSGIMKGDVVTHVNGEVFTGNASELNALLINVYEEQGTEGVVMIVVNAEECTAEALRLRSRVR